MNLINENQSGEKRGLDYSVSTAQAEGAVEKC